MAKAKRQESSNASPSGAAAARHSTREDVARKLQLEISGKGAPSARARELVGRVLAFEDVLEDPPALAEKQLDELELAVAHARRVLRNGGDALAIMTVAARARRVLSGRQTDTPNSAAAYLMLCIDHVFGEALLGEDSPMREAAVALRGSGPRLVRFEFSEEYPEYAKALKLDSIAEVIRAHTAKRGDGSKWDVLARIFKRDLGLRVDGERVRETLKPSRNARGA